VRLVIVANFFISVAPVCACTATLSVREWLVVHDVTAAFSYSIRVVHVHSATASSVLVYSCDLLSIRCTLRSLFTLQQSLEEELDEFRSFAKELLGSPSQQQQQQQEPSSSSSAADA
jgi:hypothetical protein